MDGMTYPLGECTADGWMQVQSRVIESLPDILSLNCQLDNSKDVEFWKKQEEVAVVYMSLVKLQSPSL